MCGIFGVISEKHLYNHNKIKSYAGFLYDATIASSLRGIDSAGVLGVKRGGEVFNYKRPVAPWDFVSMATTQKLYSEIDTLSGIIGHVRAPTRGTSSFSNAHPFVHDHISMVHNGTLNGVSSLGFDKWNYGTDSEHIAKALSLAKHPADVLEKIDGAFALAWFDSKRDSFFITRNKERELHFAECIEDGTVLIASEWKMLEWLAYRQGINIGTTYEVAAGTLIEIPRSTPNKMKITKYNLFVAPPIFANFDKRGHHKKESLTMDFTSAPKLIEAVGVKIGQKIEFQQLTTVLPREKSKAGIVHGIMLEAPWFFVRAAGVSTRKIDNPEKRCLTGKVRGVLDAHTNSPVIVLIDIEVSKSTKELNRTANVIYGSTELFARELPKEVTTGNPEKEIDPERKTIVGPQGRFISIVEYNELTKHGCGFCQSELSTQDSARLSWIGDSPVCLSCSLSANASRLN
jgi:predicted glutamine amidotransferase